MRGLSGLAATACALACACGSGDKSDGGEATGAALGRGLVAVAEGAELAPLPCARAGLAGADDASFEAGGRTWTVHGDELVASGGDRELVIGVVADARGGHAEDLAAAARAFARDEVELVLALGGIAGDRAGLDAALAAFASDAWPVVALPGDLEPVADLAAATAAAGPRAIDGTRVRLVRADGVALATLPGGVHPDQVPAGDRGCVATATDASAVANRLAAVDGVRAIASYVPPRQSGAGASDRTADGVHVGDPAIAGALTGELALVVSAMVEDAGDGALTGEAPVSPRTNLAAGAIDMPASSGGVRAGRALVIRVGAKRLRWRRLPILEGKLVDR